MKSWNERSTGHGNKGAWVTGVTVSLTLAGDDLRFHEDKAQINYSNQSPITAKSAMKPTESMAAASHGPDR